MSKKMITPRGMRAQVSRNRKATMTKHTPRIKALTMEAMVEIIDESHRQPNIHPHPAQPSDHFHYREQTEVDEATEPDPFACGVVPFQSWHRYARSDFQ